jgi:PIN domain nuclease of toxin-antitoxin system
VIAARECSNAAFSYAPGEIELPTFGKLTIPADLYPYILRAGLRILGLAPDAALALAKLALHHGDPFDRLLIAQARSENLTILTADHRFSDYDIPTIDANT